MRICLIHGRRKAREVLTRALMTEIIWVQLLSVTICSAGIR